MKYNYDIESIVAKFENGEERYRNSATFNVVVSMLARGVNPYQVINQLVNAVDDTTNALQQQLYRAGSFVNYKSPVE